MNRSTRTLAPWIDNGAPTRRLPPLKPWEPWKHRELIYFLALRDVKVRYKQAYFGAGWAVLQPLVGAAAFTVLFGRLAGFEVADGSSYFLFSLIGFVMWTYFSTALSHGSSSLLANGDLLTKVPIPRIALPVASLIPGLVDLAVGVVLAVFVTIAVGGGVSAPGMLVALPIGTVLMVVTVLGPALFLCSIIIRYRDFGVIVGFTLQVLLFVTPVAYPPELVPGAWQPVLHLNPMTGALALYRYAFGGLPLPDLELLGISVLSALVLFVGGQLYFRMNERDLVDII